MIRQRVVGVVCLASFLLMVVPSLAQRTSQQRPELPSETPAQFQVAGNRDRVGNAGRIFVFASAIRESE